MSNCLGFVNGELATAVEKIEKKIIVDALCRESVEHVLNSVEMKNLFGTYLAVTNNSQAHYFDYYYGAKELEKDFVLEVLERLYHSFLDQNLPKTKKIMVPTLTREKRTKLKDYIQNPSVEKLQEVKTIFEEIDQRVFDVLDEIYRRQFVQDIRKYVGL